MSKSHQNPKQPKPKLPPAGLDESGTIYASGPGQVIQVSEHKVVLSSGPLPKPDELAKYDDDTRSAILEMARAEQLHRHAIECKAAEFQMGDLKASRIERRIGQVCALTLGVGAVSASTLIAIFGTANGSAVVSGLVGVGGLGSLLMAFLVDHNRSAAKQPKERTQPNPPAKKDS